MNSFRPKFYYPEDVSDMKAEIQKLNERINDINIAINDIIKDINKFQKHNENISSAIKSIREYRACNDGYEFLLEICNKFGFDLKKIQSNLRSRELVKQRFCIAHHLYNDHNLTYSQIGRLLNRDHTTVMNMVAKYKEKENE